MRQIDAAIPMGIPFLLRKNTKRKGSPFFTLHRNLQPERLAQLLVRKYEEQAEAGLLVVSSNRQLLSNETGFGIKTVNRAIKSLTDGGYITRSERTILVNRDQYHSLKRLIGMIIASDSE